MRISIEWQWIDLMWCTCTLIIADLNYQDRHNESWEWIIIKKVVVPNTTWDILPFYLWESDTILLEVGKQYKYRVKVEKEWDFIDIRTPLASLLVNP